MGSDLSIYDIYFCLFFLSIFRRATLVLCTAVLGKERSQSCTTNQLNGVLAILHDQYA
jgi:hypothetical protein